MYELCSEFWKLHLWRFQVKSITCIQLGKISQIKQTLDIKSRPKCRTHSIPFYLTILKQDIQCLKIYLRINTIGLSKIVLRRIHI